MEVEGTATVPEVVADGNSFLLGQHDDYVTQVAVIPTISDSEPSAFDVLSAGIDGILRCHSVVLQEGSATTTQTWEVLKENFPLQAMATASNFGHSLVAVGGMGHKIHLLIRDRAKWVPLLVLATRKPVSALLIHSDSAQKKRESGHGVHWGVSVFAASQDKEVHRFTVMLSRDEKEGSEWVVTVTGSVSITGHTDHVRSVAMAPVTEGGEHYLGSASDDGLVKVWKMSTLTEQHVCEGHLDDVLSLSMDFYTPQKPIIVSGGKDRTLRIWGEGTSRAATPIACLATLRLPAVARCIVTTKPQEGETYGDVIVGCGDGQVRQWRYVKERRQEEQHHTVAIEAPKATKQRKGAKRGKRRQSGNAMDVEEPAATTTTTTIREWVEAKWVLVKSVHVHRESIASIALVDAHLEEQQQQQQAQQQPTSLIVITGANDGGVRLTGL